MKVAADVGMLTYGELGYGQSTLTVHNKAMNRYDMAFVLASTLNANGKVPTLEERNAAKNGIKDNKSIPINRDFQVYDCYHFGIITGMSDGTFSGTQSMTRAQACTVIVRMMDLIGSAAPVQQPQQTTGKLSNGKDATVENVAAMLEEIKLEYPTGTAWGPAGTPNNNIYLRSAYYDSLYGNKRDLNKLNKSVGGNTSLTAACGGWAAMVSETIFGVIGAPCREVKSASELRPGDIIYHMDKYDRPTHVAIVYQIDIQDDGVIHWRTCDGNSSAKVSWSEYNPTASYAKTYEPGKENASSRTGSYFLAFTRYPD